MPSRHRQAMPFVILASLLAATPAIAQHGDHAGHAAPAVSPEIAAAVSASTRTPANVARDKYRHPAETLSFFGVNSGQTVLEFSPGGGWYTEVLAPLLNAKGTLYLGQPAGRGFDGIKARLAAGGPAYAKVKLVEWPATTAVPSGSVDTVLTFRNVHNLVMGGNAAGTFSEFFRMLKPGGVLGAVDHRLPESRDSAVEKTSGYLKVSTVKALAEAAGFVLDGESEVNANPKDTADWPKGVWTLPPTFSNGDVDKDKYLAVGESDRMTLRFRKPG